MQAAEENRIKGAKHSFSLRTPNALTNISRLSCISDSTKHRIPVSFPLPITRRWQMRCQRRIICKRLTLWCMLQPYDRLIRLVNLVIKQSKKSIDRKVPQPYYRECHKLNIVDLGKINYSMISAT